MKTHTIANAFHLLRKGLALLLVGILIFGVLPVAAFPAAAAGNEEELLPETEDYAGGTGEEEGDPPVVTDPPQTDPPQTDPPQTEPPQTEPPQTEPPQTEPPQTEPPQTEPPQTEPPQTEPPQTEPPQTEPPQTEPPQTEPPQTEPPQTEPLEDDPDGEPEDDELDNQEDLEMSQLGATESKVKRSITKNISYLRGSTRSGSSGGLELSKTANLRSDGDYDLKLTLKGEPTSTVNSSKIDFLLIVDRSNSMVVDPDITEVRTRLEDLINSSYVLVDSIVSNPAISAEFRIMEFSGSGHPREVDEAVGDYHGYKVVEYSDWFKGSTAAADAKSRIGDIRAFSRALYTGTNTTGRYYDYSTGTIKNGLGIYGGYAMTNFPNHKQGTAFWYNLRSTNYEAVFTTINEEDLMENRDDATKVIIFLTDGDPTVTWTPVGEKGKLYDGKNNSEGYGTTYAYEENVALCLPTVEGPLKALVADRFYAVGFGEANSKSLEQVIKWAEKVPYKLYLGSDDDDLTNEFKRISDEYSTKYYSNVTVTDTLRHGENNVLKVDVVDDATIQVEVRNKNDVIVGDYSADKKSVTLPATQINGSGNVLTVSRNGDNLVLDFPDQYMLEPGYTYTLSAVIRPTEQAYREWQESGYTDTPDSGTGTHANNGQNGLFSNDRAAVTYTYGGTEGETGAVTYDHPVVRLDPGELIITKSISGLSGAQIQDLDLTFTIDLKYPDNGDELGNEEETITVQWSQMPLDDYDRRYYTIGNLSPGTEYTVTESFNTPDGYRVTSTVNGENSKTASGTVPKGGTKRADFVNNFVLATSTVRVEKQVSGNLSSEDKPFSFTVSLEGEISSMEGISYVKYSKNPNGNLIAEGKREITTETFSFQLKDDEYCVFYNVPLESSMRVGEKPEEYSLLRVEDDFGQSWQLWPDKSVLFNVFRTPDSSREYGHWMTFYNDRSAVIETGISLDSLPYILILAGVAVAGTFLVLRKSRRRYED